jgi:CheY-like chemotaxis protein
MKLFKNIVQFDAAVLQGGGGSGLGLWSKYMPYSLVHTIVHCRLILHDVCDLYAVSKAIMNAHDGQLWVTSSGIPGEGCIFGMELKVHAIVPSEIPPTGRSELIETADRTGRSVSILPSTRQSIQEEKEDNPYELVHALVVDDSPMNRKMLMLHLQSCGVRNVSQACNGLEAVQAVTECMDDNCDKKLFDIIFMDCMMPVMDGNKATMKIRELGYESSIVTVTGNGLPEDVREIMSCGSSKVLVKPVSSDAVEAVLRGK